MCPIASVQDFQVFTIQRAQFRGSGEHLVGGVLGEHLGSDLPHLCPFPATLTADTHVSRRTNIYYTQKINSANMSTGGSERIRGTKPGQGDPKCLQLDSPPCTSHETSSCFPALSLLETWTTKLFGAYQH